MSSSGADVNTATVPARRPDYSAEQQTAWQARHDELVQRARRGDIDVMFLGDSLTAGWETRGRASWEAMLGALQASGGNFGISGDRTQQVLWRLAHGEMENFSPQVVCVLIGTNNLVEGLGAPSLTRRNSPAEIVVGIASVLAMVRGRWPAARILLHGLLPRGLPDEPIRREVAEVNAALSRLSDREGWFFVDASSIFLAEDGSFRSELTTDFLHLTEAGYAAWAKFLGDPLQSLLVRPDLAPR
jgi:beta-glucosidase